MIACLLATGEPAIEMLLDPRWQAGGAMLWPIAVGQWFRVMAIPGANAVFALGYPNVLVIGNAMKVLGYVVFVPFGIYLGELGDSVLLGALWGFACGEAMSIITYRVALKHLKLNVGWQELEWCLRLAISIVVLAATRRLIADAALHPILVALLGLAVIAPIWFGPLKRTFTEVMRSRKQS